MLSSHHIFPQKLFNWWSTHPSIYPSCTSCWSLLLLTLGSTHFIKVLTHRDRQLHIYNAGQFKIPNECIKFICNMKYVCVYLHVENEKCWFHNHVETNVLATVCVDWWPCTEMISPVSPSQRHCPSLFLDNQPAGHTSTDHKSHLLYLLLTHCSITTGQPLYSLSSCWNVRLYLYTKENRKVYNHRIELSLEKWNWRSPFSLSMNQTLKLHVWLQLIFFFLLISP